MEFNIDSIIKNNKRQFIKTLCKNYHIISDSINTMEISDEEKTKLIQILNQDIGFEHIGDIQAAIVAIYHTYTKPEKVDWPKIDFSELF